MRKTLKFLDEHLEDIFLVAFLGAISVVMLLQIAMRFLFHNPLSWPEEFCRICFVYSGFLCWAYCQRKKSAIRIDVLVKLFPIWLQKVIDIVGQILMFAFYVFLFIESIGLLQTTAANGGKTSAMGMPVVIEYFALTLGVGLAAFRSIEGFIRWILAKKSGKEGTAQ